MNRTTHLERLVELPFKFQVGRHSSIKGSVVVEMPARNTSNFPEKTVVPSPITTWMNTLLAAANFFDITQ